MLREVGDLNSVNRTCFFYSSQNAANTPEGSTSRFAGFAVVGFSTRHGSVLIQGCYATGASTVRIECRNTSASELEIEPRVIFLFARQ